MTADKLLPLPRRNAPEVWLLVGLEVVGEIVGPRVVAEVVGMRSVVDRLEVA